MTVEGDEGGFTMVETIMYVAFISVVLSVFIGFGVGIADFRAKLMVMRKVHNSSRDVSGTIARYIREAEEVIIPTENNESDKLILKMPNGALDIAFENIDGVVMMTEGVAAPIALSSPDINFLDFNFLNTGHGVMMDLNSEYRYNSSGAYSYSQNIATAVEIKK